MHAYFFQVVLTRMTRSASQYRQVDNSSGTCANESSIHYCKNVASRSAEEEQCSFNMRFHSISVRLQDNLAETGYNTYSVDFNSSQPSEIVCQNIRQAIIHVYNFHCVQNKLLGIVLCDILVFLHLATMFCIEGNW